MVKLIKVFVNVDVILHLIICLLVTLSKNTCASSCCPSGCRCNSTFSSDGSTTDSYTVDCVGAGLTSIPRNIPSNTTTLILNNNSIQELSTYHIPWLPKLEELGLAENKLKKITGDFLRPFPIIKMLNLRWNELDLSDSYIFMSAFNLIKLDLTSAIGPGVSATNLHEVFQRAHLYKLEQLQLGSNRLTTLPDGFLSDLPSLQVVGLGNNSLTSFSQFIFTTTQFQQISSIDLSNNNISSLGSFKKFANLSELNVSDNMIHCECVSLQFFQWVTSHAVSLSGDFFCLNDTRGVTMATTAILTLTSLCAEDNASEDSISASKIGLIIIISVMFILASIVGLMNAPAAILWVNKMYKNYTPTERINTGPQYSIIYRGKQYHAGNIQL